MLGAPRGKFKMPVSVTDFGIQCTQKAHKAPYGETIWYSKLNEKLVYILMKVIPKQLLEIKRKYIIYINSHFFWIASISVHHCVKTVLLKERNHEMSQTQHNNVLEGGHEAEHLCSAAP